MARKITPKRTATRTRKGRKRKPARKAGFAFGRLKEKIQILGDIVSPVTPLEDWELLKE